MFPTLDYTHELEKVFEGAELVLHLTEWRDYAALDPAEVAELVDRPRILDARLTLDSTAWRAGGWTVSTLGRP